jgi:MFS family permease
VSAGEARQAPARRSVLELLRHTPRPVRVLILGVFVNRVGSFFSVFVVLFLTDVGFTAAELSAILMAVAAASMVGSLAGGWLADLHGRKAALVVSMTASAVSLGLLSMASGHIPILIAVCLVALFTQAYVPAASALIADHSAPGDRVPAFALFRLALNVGAAVGPLLAGLLASSSYTALFLVDGGTCLLFAVVLLTGLPASPRPAATTGDDNTHDAVSAPTGQRGAWPVRVLCLALLGVAMVYGQYTSTLPLHLASHGLSVRFYAIVLSVNAVLVIALELPISGLTRRLRPRVPLTLGALLIAAGIALSGLAQQPIAVLAAVAVWSSGEILLAPVAGAAVADLSPRERIGRYQGLLASAQAAGFSLGPVVGTYAYAADTRLPWLGSAVVGLIAVIAINAMYMSAARSSRNAIQHASRRRRVFLPAGQRRITKEVSTMIEAFDARPLTELSVRAEEPTNA